MAMLNNQRVRDTLCNTEPFICHQLLRKLEDLEANKNWSQKKTAPAIPSQMASYGPRPHVMW